MITKYLYNKFQSSCYDERYVEPIIEQFQIFVKKCLEKLEHIDLIIEWIHNIYTAAYIYQSLK